MSDLSDNDTVCAMKGHKSQADIWITRFAELGETAVVHAFIDHCGAQPNADNNAPIYGAARNGHFETVRYLLSYDTVDPTEAFIIAVANNHSCVVLALLGDRLRRVDPSVHDNWAICHASRHGFVGIVDALVRDERVDCLVQDSKPLRDAAAGGHWITVSFLLESHSDFTARHPDPSARDSEALREAASRGYADTVRHLLYHGEADPRARDDEALYVAAERGHRGVVTALLSDGRANPAARDNNLILIAATKGWLDIVDYIIKDGRCRPTRPHLDTVLIAAINNGYYDIARVLLDAWSQ